MEKNKKNNVAVVILSLASLICLLLGVWLLIEPYYTDKMREKVMDDYVDTIEQEFNSEGTPITITVNPHEYEIEGEMEFADEEYMRLLQEQIDGLPDYVTLEAVGILELPKINIKIPVWYDTTVITLRYGGGFYPDSHLPSQGGNTSVLAHHMRASNTMFHSLDQMEIGDEIIFTETTGQVFRYEVSEILVLSAEDVVEHLYWDYGGDDRITLVTCCYTPQGKMRLTVVGTRVETQEEANNG